MKQENRYHSNKSDGRVVYGVVVVGLVQHPFVWLPVNPPPKTETKPNTHPYTHIFRTAFPFWPRVTTLRGHGEPCSSGALPLLSA